MTRLHAGAQLDRAPGPKYLAALDFAEIAPIGPTPKAKTLARWRDGVPDDFTLSFVVPHEARGSAQGPLRFDAEMEEAVDRAAEAADALGARFAVLPTAGDVTTGQRDRDLLAAWVERWKTRAKAELVWHPTGLWDEESAPSFARRLGVIWGFDPLEVEALPRLDVAYCRLRAIGTRKSFNETLLLEVVERLLDGPEAWVALESGKSFKEAQRLAALAAEEA
ncbi:MAG: hypothetical protein SangKO_068790 [Sandaracinaceae bacterium]